MVLTISQIMRNERGKAESKVPAIITLVIIAGIVYWCMKFGVHYYRDFFFKSEVQELTKYDPFRSSKRPSDETRREDILKLAAQYDIVIPDGSNEEFLRVSPDSSGQWYQIHYKYKRVVKLLFGEPKILWFEDKVVPE